MEAKTIKTFKDLVVWQEAHKLALLVYKATEKYPNSETYGLSSQSRRAAVAVSSDIAESFKRNTLKEKIQFFSMALGSLTELENQFILSKDLNYIDARVYSEIDSQITSVHRLLNAIVSSTKNLPHSKFHIPNSQKGFTLIELVVVIALVGITSLVLVDLFLGQNRLYRTQTAELNVTNDARTLLDEVDAYVRQANRALSSYGSYTAGPQTLVLQMQSVNSSNQLIAGTYDNVVFYLTGANFYRQVFPAPASARAAATKKLASNVTGLNFTYDDPDFASVVSVATDLTIQEPAGIQSRTITISSRSKLRNY